MARTIKVGTDFSRFPAGRHLSDGPYNGQLFRERFLEPAIRQGEELTVDLAGVEGYGSSFLEEAFGGLYRLDDLPKDRISRRIHVISSDRDLQMFVEDVNEYM